MPKESTRKSPRDGRGLRPKDTHQSSEDEFSEDTNKPKPQRNAKGRKRAKDETAGLSPEAKKTDGKVTPTKKAPSSKVKTTVKAPPQIAQKVAPIPPKAQTQSPQNPSKIGTPKTPASDSIPPGNTSIHLQKFETGKAGESPTLKPNPTFDQIPRIEKSISDLVNNESVDENAKESNDDVDDDGITTEQVNIKTPQTFPTPPKPAAPSGANEKLVPTPDPNDVLTKMELFMNTITQKFDGMQAQQTQQMAKMEAATNKVEEATKVFETATKSVRANSIKISALAKSTKDDFTATAVATNAVIEELESLKQKVNTLQTQHASLLEKSQQADRAELIRKIDNESLTLVLTKIPRDKLSKGNEVHDLIKHIENISPNFHGAIRNKPLRVANEKNGAKTRTAFIPCANRDEMIWVSKSFETLRKSANPLKLRNSLPQEVIDQKNALFDHAKNDPIFTDKENMLIRVIQGRKTERTLLFTETAPKPNRKEDAPKWEKYHTHDLLLNAPSSVAQANHTPCELRSTEYLALKTPELDLDAIEANST